MRFNMKIGAVVLALVIALVGSAMWITPAAAQSGDDTTAEGITIGQLRDQVRQAGIDAAAEVLGMSPDELADALWGGKTLADLAEAANVPLSDVRAAVEEATKAARQEGIKELLAKLVADGRISQERADWIIEGIDNGWFGLGRLTERFGSFGFGYDGFGRGGFGGGRGRMLHHQPAQP